MDTDRLLYGVAGWLYGGEQILPPQSKTGEVEEEPIMNIL